MGVKVILSPQSISDLEAIVTFIAENNPERARSFGYELIDRALSLNAFPERGRVVPEIGESSVREIMHGTYRIICEISAGGESIFVLRFWHGARSDVGIKRAK